MTVTDGVWLGGAPGPGVADADPDSVGLEAALAEDIAVVDAD